MKIEIHILQNFASSNLNRDDTGAPKDCELGGVRRARISSQCLKRAMREAFVSHELLEPDERAARTKRLVQQVAEIVARERKIPMDRACRAVAAALGGAGIKADEDKDWKTQYLLFLPKALVNRLAAVVMEHLDSLAGEVEPESASDDGKRTTKSKGKRAKADAKEAVPKPVADAVKQLLASGAKTPELALFGRMIADSPDWNVDAACQVAHAVSTHRVSMEFDFYTAIDDLRRDDTAGSDMMGTVGFNSACFYRYLVIDKAALVKNLGDEGASALEQAKRTLVATVRAAVLAIPSGKQNSMAAHNPPSLVLIDVRDKAEARSLTNAFVEPVRPRPEDSGDLVSQSIQRLGKHFAALDKVYGSGGRKDLSCVIVGSSPSLGDAFLKDTNAKDRGTLDALVEASVAAAFGTAT